MDGWDLTYPVTHEMFGVGSILVDDVGAAMDFSNWMLTVTFL